MFKVDYLQYKSSKYAYMTHHFEGFLVNKMDKKEKVQYINNRKFCEHVKGISSF